MPGVDILPKFGKPAVIRDTMALEEARLKPCFICHAEKSEVHHLRTRKSGGSDEAHNILPVCRHCHRLFHDKGISFMANTFLHFKEWLENNGWKVNPVLQRWQHERP